MTAPIWERRDVPMRAARDHLGMILHIDPRDLVRVAGTEAASMVEAIRDERVRNDRRVPLHVWMIRWKGMKRAVVAVGAYSRRPTSLLSKGPPPGHQPSRSEVRP